MRLPWAFVAWYVAAGGATAVGPWLSPHLADAGLSPSAVATLLLAVPGGRLLGAPLWGWVADRVGAVSVLRLASGLATSFAGLLVLAPSTTWLPAIVLGWAISLSPWYPIVDAAVVARVGRGYGRIRVAASIAFAISVVGAGFLRDAWPLAPLVLSAGLMTIATSLTFALPALKAPPTPPGAAALRALLTHRELRPLIVAATFHGATLACYDLLFAGHLQSLGASAGAAGTAFAVGVGVEVVVLWMAPWLLARIGPFWLLAAGVASGIPRFLITGMSTSVPLLIATQALHGLHFGAFWSSATSLFAERSPEALRNTTQALLPAAAYGAGPLLGLGAATWWLRYHDLGGLYVLMAGFSATALAILLVTRAPEDA